MFLFPEGERGTRRGTPILFCYLFKVSNVGGIGNSKGPV